VLQKLPENGHFWGMSIQGINEERLEYKTLGKNRFTTTHGDEEGGLEIFKDLIIHTDPYRSGGK